MEEPQEIWDEEATGIQWLKDCYCVTEVGESSGGWA